MFKNQDGYKPITGKYFFIHIPKTAGTTFRYLLYNHFNEEQIYPNQSQLIKNGGGYLTKKEFITQIPSLPENGIFTGHYNCLLYTSPSPRDRTRSRMPSSA